MTLSSSKNSFQAPKNENNYYYYILLCVESCIPGDILTPGIQNSCPDTCPIYYCSWIVIKIYSSLQFPEIQYEYEELSA